MMVGRVSFILSHFSQLHFQTFIRCQIEDIAHKGFPSFKEKIWFLGLEQKFTNVLMKYFYWTSFIGDANTHHKSNKSYESKINQF